MQSVAVGLARDRATPDRLRRPRSASPVASVLTWLKSEAREAIAARSVFSIAVIPLVVVSGAIAGMFGWIQPWERAALWTTSLLVLGLMVALVVSQSRLERSSTAPDSAVIGEYEVTIELLEYLSAMVGGGTSLPADSELHSAVTSARRAASFITFEQQVAAVVNELVKPARTRFAFYYGDIHGMTAGRVENWKGQPPTFLANAGHPELDGFGARLLDQSTKSSGLLIPDLQKVEADAVELGRFVIDHVEGFRFSIFRLVPNRGLFVTSSIIVRPGPDFGRSDAPIEALRSDRTGKLVRQGNSDSLQHAWSSSCRSW